MDLARRIDALHDELLAAAAEVPNDIDAQFVELQALSMRHLANHLGTIGEETNKDT